MWEFTTMEPELRLGYTDADAQFTGGRGASCHQLPLSCLSASWLTLIQWTSVLSAVVQRAVYPANVQLINLWSWPKIEAIQLCAGLCQGYKHRRPHWFQKSLPLPPFIPFLHSDAFTGEKSDCVAVPAAAKASGSGMAFIKTATIAAKCISTWIP